MISANGGLPAHRYTPQVTQRWPRGSEPASLPKASRGVQSTAKHESVVVVEDKGLSELPMEIIYNETHDSHDDHDENDG